MIELFNFMQGHASWAEDNSIEKYLCALEEAVTSFNETAKTEYDFYEILEDFMLFKSGVTE